MRFTQNQTNHLGPLKKQLLTGSLNDLNVKSFFNEASIYMI